MSRDSSYVDANPTKEFFISVLTKDIPLIRAILDVQIFERFEGYVAHLDENQGIVKLWANSQEFSRVFDREMLRKNNVDKKGLAVEVRTIIAFGNPRLTIRPLVAAPSTARGKEKFTLQELDLAEFGDIL